MGQNRLNFKSVEQIDLITDNICIENLTEIDLFSSEFAATDLLPLGNCNFFLPHTAAGSSIAVPESEPLCYLVSIAPNQTRFHGQHHFPALSSV